MDALSVAAARSPVAHSLRRKASGMNLRSFASTAMKWMALLTILLNCRSWPFMWHFRVWRPFFSIKLREIVARIRMARKPAPVRESAIKAAWQPSNSPIGMDPLEYVTTYKTWAGFDDCDYNFHLSNSCYAKILDIVRFKAAIASFPNFFRVGGSMALGATHWDYIKEIPFLARYEVRYSLAAWDGKWIYVVARFVTHPQKSKSKQGRPTLSSPSSTESLIARPVKGLPVLSELPTTDAGPGLPTPISSPTFRHFPRKMASISSLAHALERSSTDKPRRSSGGATYPSPPETSVPTPMRASSPIPTIPSLPASPPTRPTPLRAQTLPSPARVAPVPEPDGATVHCVAVSAMCFKAGRLTVPPGLVLAADGFCDAGALPADFLVSRGARRPRPVHMDCVPKDDRKLWNLHKGGWRDVPEADRWWEVALGGEVERRRAEGCEILKGIIEGTESARSIAVGV